MEEIKIGGSCQGSKTTHLQQKIMQEYEKGAEFYIVDIEATLHLRFPNEAGDVKSSKEKSE